MYSAEVMGGGCGPMTVTMYQGAGAEQVGAHKVPRDVSLHARCAQEW